MVHMGNWLIEPKELVAAKSCIHTGPPGLELHYNPILYKNKNESHVSQVAETRQH